jgi:hypothetical protein
MRKALAVALMLGLINAPLLEGAATLRSVPVVPAAPQQDAYYEPYSPEQLDNLLAPIALYPDPLLAQVLLAATFADQIDEAARYVRAYGQTGIDDQPWDVSVKAVAHYPSVLFMMADKLDWTTALGQAYVNQSTDVMTSVQRLRALARSQGNLITTPQQEVVVEDGFIYIWPVQPQYLYVPVYDPYIVYYRRWPGWGPFFIGFSIGFLIGVWLNHDCDWHRHRVYYTGWRGRGWIERCRPYIRTSTVYVHDRYTNVYVNREIVRRNVNYYNLNRYNSVHRDVRFDNHVRGREIYKPSGRVNNQIIDRNINTGDPRLDRYRGHEERGRAVPPSAAPAPQPSAPPGPPQAARPAPQPPARPAPPPVARPTAPPQVRPQPPPQPRPQPRAFGRGEGNFDSRVASQRGQSSRSAAAQPPRSAPPSRPSAPRSAPAPQGRPSGRSR